MQVVEKYDALHGHTHVDYEMIPWYSYLQRFIILVTEMLCMKSVSVSHTDTCLDGEGGSDLHTFPQFEDLFTWIDECLAEVARDISRSFDLNRKGDYFYDNCFASSNYYVNGGPGYTLGISQVDPSLLTIPHLIYVEDRITIAANAFPDGLINATGVSHLNVQVL